MQKFQDAHYEGKKVLLRADFNVPLKDGKIFDDTRIKIALKTISYLLDNHTKLILLTHLGRPGGKFKKELQLEPIAKRLSKLLGLKGRVVKGKINGFSGYKISPEFFLLENIRFFKEEDNNDPKFAQKLASLAKIYVNDAFSVSHREHASTEGVTHFLRSYAGFQLKKEVKFLSRLRKHPERPFVCILGGAKVSEKIGVIGSLVKKVDWFLLGGVMASTFLAAQGIDVRKSVIAWDKLTPATEFWKKFGEKIILPSQVIFGELNGKRAILDIGKYDIDKFGSYIKQAKTIFWNGNLGVSEREKYARGSLEIAKKIVDSSAFTVCAGGDTISFLNKAKLLDRFSYVSYGGGASLEFLAGKKFKSLGRLL